MDEMEGFDQESAKLHEELAAVHKKLEELAARRNAFLAGGPPAGGTVVAVPAAKVTFKGNA